MNFLLSDQTNRLRTEQSTETPLSRKKRSLSSDETSSTQLREAFFQELRLEKELAELNQEIQGLTVKKEPDGKKRRYIAARKAHFKNNEQAGTQDVKDNSNETIRLSGPF